MTTPTAPTIAQVAEQNRVARAIEREDAIQNPVPPEPNLSQEIIVRAERGWDLHLTKRQLITKVGTDTYRVPATKRGRFYEVCTQEDERKTAHRGAPAVQDAHGLRLQGDLRQRGGRRPIDGDDPHQGRAASGPPDSGVPLRGLQPVALDLSGGDLVTNGPVGWHPPLMRQATEGGEKMKKLKIERRRNDLTDYTDCCLGRQSWSAGPGFCTSPVNFAC
jgi:hypothetical protein